MNCDVIRSKLSGEWEELVCKYAPHSTPATPLWRCNRLLTSSEPDQGWKIHVSAHALDAAEVLAAAAPILKRCGVAYKVPGSLDELIKINAGIFYGYSQVGKFITVYPRSDREFVRLADALHNATAAFSGPAVPFEDSFAHRSSIYYRYGSFRIKTINSRDGSKAPMILTPEGRLTADNRLCPNQFQLAAPQSSPIEEKNPIRIGANKLQTTYKTFEAIVQRGKGGVYLAVDTAAHPCRMVILKEGRRHGETAWDGSDGEVRIRNELRALRELRASGIGVPKIYDHFRIDGNFYLVLEKIEGQSFHKFLARRLQKSLSLSEICFYGRQVARAIAEIHAAGWVWRDCKPSNFIIGDSGFLRPIDFEGACRAGRPQQLAWGSDGFAAPEVRRISEPVATNLPEDLYALGAFLYFLCTCKAFDPHRPLTKILRRDIPRSLTTNISALLDPVPASRPSACHIASLLAEYDLDVAEMHRL